ncbi:hypothetical protein C0993_004714 [Termitomyces sp. T159_Od127]|nr:hypothetical protein C0993_004714 [Termitomyces sp. T159_Od127]
MPIQQPSNQINETNLDDVLQISNVFVNVSKGELAKSGDLQKAFGTADVAEVVKEVLKKGEVQVGEKERDHDLSSLRKEIATLVAEKCVDPATQRPYPVGMIEKAMAEAGFSVKQNKTAKSQVGSFLIHSNLTLTNLNFDKVSECIKLLQSDSNLPIQRAKMRVRVTMPTADSKRLRERIIEGAEKVEDDETGQEEWEVVMLIDPSQFRVINEVLQKECKGRGRIETMTFSATANT